MSDQCQHCTVRGNMGKCLTTKCNIHGSWFVKEIKRVYNNDIVLMGSLLDHIEALLDGKEVSDFALSFPIVRRVSELIEPKK